MASSAQGDDEDGITGINITPLVDIILVLLIIFMMTASYIVTPAISISLPKAQNAEEAPDNAVSLVLTKEGELYANNNKVTDAELKSLLQREKQKTPELSVVLGADASLSHGRVIAIIDLIKGEGITKLGLSTQAEFSAPKAEERPPE
ncbi:MAG: biopolymer transporter ExbD [Myxococcota bacterium]